MPTNRAVTSMSSDRVVIRLIADRMTDAWENITPPPHPPELAPSLGNSGSITVDIISISK